ncbi:mitochondrial carrier domain-containing protein [Cladochytrium replicatum]|nr:mitochondrial carrier domain-containing protein [Cladochytrium replicatum]
MGRREKPPPGIHLLGGAAGSLTSVLLVQPLDLLKTRVQQELIHVDRANLIKLPASRAASAALDSVVLLKVGRHVVRENGVMGLWRGTRATVFRNVPGSAGYFFILNELRTRMKGVQSQRLSNDTINLVAGASARGIAAFCLQPMSVIKSRFESNHYSYTSIWGATKSIVKTEGIHGLFLGLTSTILRDCPAAGLFIVFFDRLKATFGQHSLPGSPYHASVTATSSATATIIVTFLTNPFDVLRTRIQINPTQYPNIRTGSIEMFKQDGFRAFFSGILPRLLRKTISGAITWTVYEQVVHRLNRRDRVSLSH